MTQTRPARPAPYRPSQPSYAEAPSAYRVAQTGHAPAPGSASLPRRTCSFTTPGSPFPRPGETRVFTGGVTGRRRTRRPRSRAIFFLALALIASAAATLPGLASSLLDTFAPPSGPLSAILGAGGSPASTPISEWKRGEVPFLYQTDPQWAEEPYAGGTIAENGCGPTCLAMAYVCTTGKTDFDPAAAAAFSERNGYVSGNMTAWLLMTEGASQLGMTSEELPADASRVLAALESGRPVICSVRPGDFTTTGHFIVLAGVADDGTVVVHDPNSPDRSAQTWDVQRVIDQCNNLWAFSA